MNDFFATKSGVTIYATLDIPLLRIPPNVFVSRITCIYSSCVSFNENWPLLATLAPLTCCPFWVQIGATIHATLDVPSLRIPPNVIVSRYTCIWSFCVSFNENWPLLTTLVPFTRRPFCEQFLRDKKWRHNLYAMLNIPSLRMLPNVFVSRITCIYSSCLSFNENRILLTTVAICTSRPFLEQLGENV